MRTSHHDTSTADSRLESDLRRNVAVAAWGLALAVAAVALLLAQDAPQAPSTSLAVGLTVVVAVGIGITGTAARGAVSAGILSMLLTEPAGPELQAQAQAQAHNAGQDSPDTRAAGLLRPLEHPLKHSAAAVGSAPL